MGTIDHRRLRTVTALLLGALLAVGCSSGGDQESLDAAGDDGAARTASGAAEHWTSGAPSPDAAYDDDVATEGEATDQGDAPAAEIGGSGDRALPVAATLGRRVIRTATLELEDADPGAVADEVTRVVDRAGGFVATADLRRDDDGVLSGSVTVRVPSERLEATLDQLEALADNAPVRRIEEQDVTVESADLRAQLRNLEVFEGELRELLVGVGERSSDADDLLRVYERIREVRAEIDRIQGRVDVLTDQVSLATVTVRLTPTIAAVPVADPGWAPGETVRAALAAASRGLAAIANAAIWIGLAVLPVVAVVGLPLAAAWAGWRRWQRAAPETTPPA